MPGLLKRAMDLHDHFFGINSIPQSERDKIFGEIDQIILDNKFPVTDQTFRYKPIRDDRRFLIIINCLAVFLILSIGYGLYRYFDTAEQSIISRSRTLNLTENQIIEAIKTESEKKLSDKEKEIQTIQEEMGKIFEEQSLLLIASKEEITRLEAALRDKYNSDLMVETERLNTMGISTEESDRRLAAFKKQMELDFQNELNQIIQTVEEDRQRKDELLQKRIAGYEESLRTAREEKKDLEEKEARLLSERDTARTNYEELLEQNSSEQFILNRVTSFYKEISDSLLIQDYPEALVNIQELELYLDNPDFISFPKVSARMETDLLLLTSIKEMIHGDWERENSENSSAEALLLEEITDLVNRGNDFYRRQDYSSARLSFLKALALFPPVQEGYSLLVQMERKEHQDQQEQFFSYLERGNEAFNDRALETAGNVYLKSLSALAGREPEVRTLVENLMEIGAITALEELGDRLISEEDLAALKDAKKEQQKKQDLIVRLSEIKKSLSDTERTGSSAEDEDLMKILSTKILIKEVLASDLIQAENPGLHIRLEEYLDTYGEIRENEGRDETIKQFRILLNSLDGYLY